MSITVEPVRSGRELHAFVTLPWRLYRHDPQWIPPLIGDTKKLFDPRHNPFFEHGDIRPYLARRDGRVVGRIAAIRNRNHEAFQGEAVGFFGFFECEDDLEAAAALFEQVFEWARQRGLDKVVGPKGFGPLDGYGMLVDGYEHRQMMTMMNYNFPYHVRLVEAQGFTKEVDFVSCHLEAGVFKLPERIHSIAERVQQRGTLRVLRFNTKGELKSWAKRIGKAYNQAFVNNWEYVPLTEREIEFVVGNILTIADPRLIKVIAHDVQNKRRH